MRITQRPVTGKRIEEVQLQNAHTDILLQFEWNGRRREGLKSFVLLPYFETDSKVCRKKMFELIKGGWLLARFCQKFF